MNAKFSILLLISGVYSASAIADDSNLAKAKNCMACHAMATKLVGPSFKEVAKKYAGQMDAEEKLAQKILKGSNGNWGAIPMPGNPQVTTEEADHLATWVLSLK